MPKSHWDYTYHGSFEDASYDSSYPKADQKGTSRPWLDAGLGRDLNLYINNGGQYGSGQHTSDLEAGYITPTSASNAAFHGYTVSGYPGAIVARRRLRVPCVLAFKLFKLPAY